MKKEKIQLLCYTLIVGSLLFTTSCAKLLLRVTGNYITPRAEDSISIMNYLTKHQVTFDEAYVLSSKNSYLEFIGKYPNLPGTILFNSEKRLLVNADGGDCPWAGYYSLIDTTEAVRNIHFKVDSLDYEKNTYLDINRLVRPIFIKINDSIHYDNYIYCVWAKYTPKFTRDLFKDLYRFKNSKDKQIRLILIDLDFQKEWQEENARKHCSH